MKINPTHDRLLVEAIPPERRLKSGLILPETADNQSQHGTVTAVGPDWTVAKVGDQVLYSKFGGTEIELHGEKLLLLREVDILGLVEFEETDGEVADDADRDGE